CESLGGWNVNERANVKATEFDSSLSRFDRLSFRCEFAANAEGRGVFQLVVAAVSWRRAMKHARGPIAFGEHRSYVLPAGSAGVPCGDGSGFRRVILCVPKPSSTAGFFRANTAPMLRASKVEPLAMMIATVLKFGFRSTERTRQQLFSLAHSPLHHLKPIIPAVVCAGFQRHHGNQDCRADNAAEEEG